MGLHGQGTKVQLPNGRWMVAVTMPDGRRVYRRARTQRDAERIRRALVEARELDLDPSRQTVADYLRSWISGLDGARNQRVRPRTFQHYAMIVEAHLVPALGGVKLSVLSPRHVQAFLDADAYSPRTVHHHHAVLRRALNVAVRQRLLPYNPAEHVELPSVDEDKGNPLSPDEAASLLRATEGDRLHPLWRLAIITGLRQGELLGLAWDNVEPHAVTVERQLQRLAPDKGGDANGWALTRTKSARKVQRVAIDDTTADNLEAHRKRQAAERRPDWRYFGLVFVTDKGDPYHPSVILKAFRAACAKAGIPRRRFHDLRHTSLTILRDEGVDEDTRMARAGHNTTTMARRYARASEEQDRHAAEAISRRIAATG